MSNLSKRVITSLILLLTVSFAFIYSFILIVLLILVSVFSWIEFNNILIKIFKKDNISSRFFKIFFKGLSLIYLVLFSILIFNNITQEPILYKINLIYIFLVCIFSDIGGYIFGNVFKGKKLTKISPKKTISGSLGSFFLPMILIPAIIYLLSNEGFNNFNLLILIFSVSLVCQLGDLFISFLKRKAKVKDTGDLLPGHGGILDRIDGILFAIPYGIIISNILIF
tara:strand:+ start:702 stop:1376 length:675 start_codon:yes stop_codon:yes gene_type:complete